jgi:G:T-mismatch repair DNA endonuclease (very short patch repair protein)
MNIAFVGVNSCSQAKHKGQGELAPKAKHNYWAKKKKENYKKTIPP